MKTIVGFCCLLLSCTTFTAFAEQARIVKDFDGYRVSKVDPARDTGITIEEGLVLPSHKLERIIDKRQGVPVNSSLTPIRWETNMMYIEFESRSTVQAKLYGRMIKKVNETVVAKFVMMNPFYVCTFIYIICMIFLSKQKNGTGSSARLNNAVFVCACGSGGFAFMSAGIANSYVAAIGTGIASIACLVAHSRKNDVATYNEMEPLIGVLVMIVSAVLMYFFI